MLSLHISIVVTYKSRTYALIYFEAISMEMEMPMCIVFDRDKVESRLIKSKSLVGGEHRPIRDFDTFLNWGPLEFPSCLRGTSKVHQYLEVN